MADWTGLIGVILGAVLGYFAATLERRSAKKEREAERLLERQRLLEELVFGIEKSLFATTVPAMLWELREFFVRNGDLRAIPANSTFFEKWLQLPQLHASHANIGIWPVNDFDLQNLRADLKGLTADNNTKSANIRQ